jgi:anthranilate phosphoribosyltransferase
VADGAGKHGSKASTSTSGSADLLAALGAHLPSVTADTVSSIYASPTPRTNFAFIYAPNFHPAMQHIAVVRKLLGLRTIFNVLGPLISPVDYSLPGGLEARVLGVGRLDIGPVYAETLKLLGVRQALVVCGAEQLDEISTAGYSYCWRLREAGSDVVVESFKVHPTETFGLGCHPLDDVAGGKGPEENAEIFARLLRGQVADGDAVKDFVLVNAAALLVISGAAEGEESVGEDGVMRGSLWKDAVQRAKKGMEGGEALKEWESFVAVSKDAQRRDAGTV